MNMSMYPNLTIRCFDQQCFCGRVLCIFPTGQVKSNKKEELIRILDRFNIQVDNPVSLLNQETSRNFLHSTNPRTLYQVKFSGTSSSSSVYCSMQWTCTYNCSGFPTGQMCCACSMRWSLAYVCILCMYTVQDCLNCLYNCIKWLQTLHS